MFLSYIKIQNFKGIKDLEVYFDPKLNIIIGENGCNKTGLIDAIRIFYNLGNPKKDYYVSNDDFYFNKKENKQSNRILLEYHFDELSDGEKGALYEYLVMEEGEVYGRIVLTYELRKDMYPKFSYFTGDSPEQKADQGTFDIFQHYYLGALRDSTTDLLNTKTNMLGSVIKRLVERKGTEEAFRDIIRNANKDLLKRDEVLYTRDGVNKHLDDIFSITKDNQIGMKIEPSLKIESILNIIKPYLPHDKSKLDEEGFNLLQNSLGFNNLIYIAIILGDIGQRVISNIFQHFALLIEEPEAHLHPQLQLNLYNFLKSAGKPDNCQLFITSHSPTLTSKADLDNLILVSGCHAINIGDCFSEREEEQVIEAVDKRTALSNEDFKIRKKQLERYLDVTKSQLFFARSVIFVEGVSEKLLLKSFSDFINLNLENHRCEVVNIEGISFNPFIHLFNSDDRYKRIHQNASLITDDDRYAKAKNSFSNLTKKGYKNLKTFHEGLYQSNVNNRTGNLRSAIRAAGKKIKLCTAFKTLEYEMALANIAENRTDFDKNFLVKYIKSTNNGCYTKINEYLQTLPTDILNNEQRQKASILLWKALPGKAEFAQAFSYKLDEAVANKEDIDFKVPEYIENAIRHATK